MTDHRIRLRGGWQRRDAHGGPGARRVVTLPMPPPLHAECPFALDRAFQTPALDPNSETLLLALDDVAGVSRVLLNGDVIACPDGGQHSLLLPVDGLVKRRNVLTLEVEPTACPDAAPGQATWGSVSLVIRRKAARDAQVDALGESGEVS